MPRWTNPLTAEQNAEIDQRIDAGETVVSLAAEYGATPNSIYRRRYVERDPDRQREQHRKWREENRDKAREWSRRYYRENLEERRAVMRELARRRRQEDPDLYRRYYEANREKELARGRANRDADREAWREKNRRWQRENPEKNADKQQRRRAMAARGWAEDVRRSEVWKRDDGVCGICGQQADPSSWHLDHIIPLARGGAHSYANVQVAHPTCNIAKGAR